MGMIAAFNFRR
jgi:hypothetical protein